MKPIGRRALLLAAAVLTAQQGLAAEGISVSASNLVAVLRESAGENKQDELLQPYGQVLMQLEDGRELEIETGWYRYLGDMHIRLVFDGPQQFQSATPEELARMQLDAQRALDLAASNLRRLYGAPQVRPWQGMLQVAGRATDLSSSYFLDRQFWMDQQRQHPQGLVAAAAAWRPGLRARR